jgi:hypothetical protein
VPADVLTPSFLDAGGERRHNAMQRQNRSRSLPQHFRPPMNRAWSLSSTTQHVESGKQTLGDARTDRMTSDGDSLYWCTANSNRNGEIQRVARIRR